MYNFNNKLAVQLRVGKFKVLLDGEVLKIQDCFYTFINDKFYLTKRNKDNTFTVTDDFISFDKDKLPKEYFNIG